MNAKELEIMKITVLGASGNVGQRLVAESLLRGHTVTAVARRLDRLSDFPREVSLRAGDISNPADVADLAAGQDVLINATRPDSGDEQRVGANTRGLLQGLVGREVRLLIVGGAAGLVVPGAAGITVIDDPRYLSPALRHVGEASLAQYRLCREEKHLNWAYFCPPAALFPGVRTGRFRRGGNVLILDDEGNSRLSMEDLAVVLLDEIETPSQQRQCFTAAY
jgi:putative NADH-flavin reductase